MIRKYGYALCLAIIFCLIAACSGNDVSTVSNNRNNTEADASTLEDTSNNASQDVSSDTGETEDASAPDKCELIDCIEHSTCDPATGLCVCNDGYDMGEDADGVSICADQCLTMKCGENTIGCEAGVCICDEGYESDGGLGCKKIVDEESCVDRQESCQDHATCDSESGQCVCDAGYNPNDAGTECIDACVHMRCGPNTSGCEAGECICAEGYEKVDGKCVPIKDLTCGNIVCPEYSRCEQDLNKCVCDFGEKEGLGGINDVICKTPCEVMRCDVNSTCDPDLQQCVCDPGYILVEGQGCQQL